MTSEQPVLLFVCPHCQASRSAHGMCCGIWPIAVDLADCSWRAAIASLAIKAIHNLCFVGADAESPGSGPVPPRVARP
jgi:hypothetical protein